MKKAIVPLFVLGLLLAQGCQKTEIAPVGEDLELTDRANCSRQIVIPAGSVDALAQAIEDVCPGGTILLAAGLHTENAGVLIDKKITLKGVEGAVLKVNTLWSGPPFPITLDVALWVKNAAGTRIENIEIQPTGSAAGGTAVLLHNSKNAVVKNCEMLHHQYGIIVQGSDNVQLTGNFIDTAPEVWQVEGMDAHGIIIVNGKGAKLSGNEVINSFFGIWLCDKNGHYHNNNTHHNYIGMILCKVPAGAILLEDGTAVDAQFSATNWQVVGNVSTDNFDVGYLVIDGANGNHLVNNEGGNNGTYDIELVGDSYRFGSSRRFASTTRSTPVASTC